MTITELTTASAWIAGFAIVALIATGWRKPARAVPVFTRARRTGRPPAGITVIEDAAPLDRGTPWWRRVIAVFGSGVIAVVMGAVLATVASVGVAAAVIRLTTLLRR